MFNMNTRLLHVTSGASWVLLVTTILASGYGDAASPGGGAKLKTLTIPKIDPNAPFPELSANVFDALSAEVPALAKHREAVLAAERDAIKGAVDDMRAKSKAAKKKVSDAMPEPARFRMLTLEPWSQMDVAAAPAKGAGNHDWLASLIGGLFNLIPVAMAAELDFSNLGLVQQFGIGHQVGSMMGAGISDMGTSDSGSKTVSLPGETEGTVVSSLTVSATPGGPPSAELATTISIPLFLLDANSKVSITGNLCPNPAGKVDFSIKLGSKGRAGSAGLVIYDQNIEARVMVTVGDDANVVSVDFDMKQATRSTAGGRQVYVETSRSAQMPGGDYSKAKYGESKTTRASSEATADDGRLSEDGLERAYALAMGALESAKKHWQGGKCIKIEATSPGKVEPGSTTAIPVTVRHRLDGSEVTSKLDAVLSGEKSVHPASIARTPGTLTYTAPDKKKATATIALTANSRRGRATLDLTASTGGQSYTASGGAKIQISGTVCDLEKSFQLTGKGNNGISYDFEFSPNNSTSGSMSYSGSASGCKESGAGPYTIKLSDDGKTGTVDFTASGAVACSGVGGSFSGRGGDFKLTEAPPCP